MAFTLNPASILGPEFYGFLLPWIFTFAIVYGLLLKLNVFEKKEKISLALAFVIAFFVTGAAGPQLAAFFINLFGGAVMYMAGILVLILFMALAGYDITKTFQHKLYLIAIILIAVALFLGSTGNFLGYIVIGSDVATLAFWLIIIVMAVYMITTEKGGAPAK
jgi:hypothetical protein